MAMVDMTLSKEEANEEAGISPDVPRYPYGLSLCLDDDSLQKLGLTQLPDVGSVMTITAQVKVTGVREYANRTEDGKDDSEQSVDMQITAMEISTAQPATSAATALYGKD